MDTSSDHFPLKTPLYFTGFNVAGMRKKFDEHNTSEGNPSYKLSADEINSLFAAIFESDKLRDQIDPSSLGPLEKAFNWREGKWLAFDVLRLCLRCNEVQKVWLQGDKGEAIIKLLTQSATTNANSAETFLALRYFYIDSTEIKNEHLTLIQSAHRLH